MTLLINTSAVHDLCAFSESRRITRTHFRGSGRS
jgi:hypothetical protein